VPLVLWDANTGKRVRTFPRESMGAEHVRFDAAGTTITTVNGFHGRRTEQRTDVTVYPTVGTWRVLDEKMTRVSAQRSFVRPNQCFR
jgi:hypothetical protein